MCTVTILREGDRVRLACNRDEALARPPAVAPRLYRLGPRRALLPLDPLSGGTWVAASDAGLGMALLNVNPATPPTVFPECRSRGSIIPLLLHTGSLSEAIELACALPPWRYAPFRLVLVDREEMAEVVADGRRIALARRAALTEPLLFTSSGLGDHLVEGPRRRLFEAHLSAAVDRPSQQDAFHRHHWPDRPHLSVCMRRTGAATVSFTSIEILPDRVSLSYRPLPPCRWAEPTSLSLELTDKEWLSCSPNGVPAGNARDPHPMAVGHR